MFGDFNAAEYLPDFLSPHRKARNSSMNVRKNVTELIYIYGSSPYIFMSAHFFEKRNTRARAFH